MGRRSQHADELFSRLIIAAQSEETFIALPSQTAAHSLKVRLRRYIKSLGKGEVYEAGRRLKLIETETGLRITKAEDISAIESVLNEKAEETP